MANESYYSPADHWPYAAKTAKANRAKLSGPQAGVLPPPEGLQPTLGLAPPTAGRPSRAEIQRHEFRDGVPAVGSPVATAHPMNPFPASGGYVNQPPPLDGVRLGENFIDYNRGQINPEALDIIHELRGQNGLSQLQQRAANYGYHAGYSPYNPPGEVRNGRPVNSPFSGAAQHPENDGLANTLRNIQSINSTYSRPSMLAGGGQPQPPQPTSSQGAPSDAQLIERGRLGAEQAQFGINGRYSGQGAATGSQPLGLAPTNVAQHGQQMQAQNPGGIHYQGALPAIGMSSGGRQRPMFMGPPADLQPASNAGAGDYRLAQSDKYGKTAGGSWAPKKVLSPGHISAAGLDAKKLAANKAAYQTRVGADIANRRAGVQEKSSARAESRRLNQGRLSFEERLASATPEMYQQRQAQEAALKRQQDSQNLALGLQRDQIQSRERIAKTTADSRVLAQGLDPATGLPAKALEIQNKPEPANEPGWPQRLFGWLGEQVVHGTGLGSQISQNMPPPVRATRGGRVTHGSPGEVIKNAKNIKHSDLIDQPGDTPQIKAFREQLRKKYPGMATQNRIAGRI